MQNVLGCAVIVAQNLFAVFEGIHDFDRHGIHAVKIPVQNGRVGFACVHQHFVYIADKFDVLAFGVVALRRSIRCLHTADIIPVIFFLQLIVLIRQGDLRRGDVRRFGDSVCRAEIACGKEHENQRGQRQLHG